MSSSSAAASSAPGVLLDAVSRGLRAALVEQDDLAVGTSSRSSRLIHGGVRYLEDMRLHLVREALAERSRLMTLAPHLVRLERFLFPVYGWPVVHRAMFSAGLTLYDVLGAARDGGRAHHLGAGAVAELIPPIVRRGLRGGVTYSDGVEDDARYSIAVARTAMANGATVGDAGSRHRPPDRRRRAHQRAHGPGPARRRRAQRAGRPGHRRHRRLAGPPGGPPGWLDDEARAQPRHAPGLRARSHPHRDGHDPQDPRPRALPHPLPRGLDRGHHRRAGQRAARPAGAHGPRGGPHPRDRQRRPGGGPATRGCPGRLRRPAPAGRGARRRHGPHQPRAHHPPRAVRPGACLRRQVHHLPAHGPRRRGRRPGRPAIPCRRPRRPT